MHVFNYINPGLFTEAVGPRMFIISPYASGINKLPLQFKKFGQIARRSIGILFHNSSVKQNKVTIVQLIKVQVVDGNKARRNGAADIKDQSPALKVTQRHFTSQQTVKMGAEMAGLERLLFFTRHLESVGGKQVPR